MPFLYSSKPFAEFWTKNVFPQMTLEQILQPAIDLAEQGFPVHPMAAQLWEADSACLSDACNKHGKDMLFKGTSPRAGDVMKMPLLAKTFKVKS